MAGPMALSMLFLLHASMACDPPHCEWFDCGTCGVPCCTLDFTFPTLNSTGLGRLVEDSLKSGGPDGRYGVEMFHWQGWDRAQNPHDVPNSAAEPRVAWSVTGTHKTSGTSFAQMFHLPASFHYQFVDRIALVALAQAESHTAASLRASSVSAAASPNHMCDRGQNYHNVVALVHSFGVPIVELARHGCGVPSHLAGAEAAPGQGLLLARPGHETARGISTLPLWLSGCFVAIFAYSRVRARAEAQTPDALL